MLAYVRVFFGCFFLLFISVGTNAGIECGFLGYDKEGIKLFVILKRGKGS